MQCEVLGKIYKLQSGSDAMRGIDWKLFYNVDIYSKLNANF